MPTFFRDKITIQSTFGLEFLIDGPKSNILPLQKNEHSSCYKNDGSI
jgi:hypothetical protein